MSLTDPDADTAANDAPASISKLLYNGIRTRDVGAIVAHYTGLLEFTLVEQSGGSAYLSVGPDHHCVVVEEGEPSGRSRMGLLLHGALTDAADRLAAAGIATERRSDPEPGIGADLIITEPGTGTPLHLVEDVGESGVASSLGVTPSKLGHVAAFAPDMAAIQEFYEAVLGFKWADTIGDFFVFLRCNSEHHAANFMESSKRSGLHHVAYEMRDIVHLKNMLDQLAKHERRLEWGPGRHGPGHNIFTYHYDPDQNVIELFTELDVVHDERTGAYDPRPWHDSFPQVPRVWPLDPVAANSWGPINPVFLDH